MMKITPLLLALSAAMPPVATAQNEAPPARGGPPPEVLERFDKDGDGRLNEEERATLRAEFDQNRGGPAGRGGGGPGGSERESELVPIFDVDGDGVLNDEERQKARVHAKANPPRRGGGPGGRRRGPGGGGPGGGGPTGPPKPGEKLKHDEVAHFPAADLYDPAVLHTLFLEFDAEDWEDELADFYRTDVVVPARLNIDGESLEHPVGLSFRGNSSYFSVSAGRKRSFNLVADAFDDGQRVKGYNTLNLLNGHADPSFIREALFSHIVSRYLPMYKVSLVKVVINGESWGIYVNAQQFNKDYLAEHFDTREGVRWKLPAGGDGGFRYPGDDRGMYSNYQLKTGSAGDEAWEHLIALCKTLHDATAENAIETLSPILDVDRALWFLAVDNVFQDGDGYLSRASDFVFYEDPGGRFHILPYDSNETFRASGGGGPGFGGPGGGFRGRGPGGGFRPPPDGGPRPEGRPGGREGGQRPAPEGRGSPERRDPDQPEGRRPGGDGPGRGNAGGGDPYGREPLLGADDERLPLVKTLLSVPSLRARYLHHVRVISEDWLDWEKIEPVAMQLHELIKDEVSKDTRKLYTTESFQKNITEEVSGGRRATPGIKEFVEGRAEFLENHKDLQASAPRIERVTTGVKAKPGQAVTIKATMSVEPAVATAVLHYRAGGHGPYRALPMRIEGNEHLAEIPGASDGTLIQYYVEARTADDAAAAFHPRYGERTPESFRVSIIPRTGSAPVRLNELMAANIDTIADPQGDFDDWIEFHNTGEDVVDLSGYSLSDREGKLDKWSFPRNTTIAPGGFLLVWADEDGGKKKGLHANFKLARSGETVILSDTEGTILDVISYDSLGEDKSYARNGEGWAVQVPTPAKPNR